MSDEGMFKTPAPRHRDPSASHPEYSPQASILIKTTQDSNLNSAFSPTAFGAVQREAVSDAMLDAVPHELDDIVLELQEPPDPPHSTSLALPATSLAAPSSHVTPAPTREPIKVVTHVLFDPTPDKKAAGRNYSRATLFKKASLMHIYGGVGALTLVEYALHACHVLAVALKDALVSSVLPRRPHILNVHHNHDSPA